MPFRALASLAAICAFGLLVAACATRTEVIIAVESDIPTIDRISIVVTNPAGMTQSSVATFGTGAEGFVRTLGVTYSGGSLGPFVATATGTRGGATVVSRSAVFEFVRGETRVIRLDLLASCQGVTCATDQTCGETGCRARMLMPSELEPYTGSVPSHDAAATLDAGGGGIDSGGGGGADTGGAQLMCMGAVCAPAHSTDPSCMMGRCTIGTCDTGFMNCDNRNSTGCEIDTRTDVDNCGDCGMQCRGGTPMCCNGTCAASCP